MQELARTEKAQKNPDSSLSLFHQPEKAIKTLSYTNGGFQLFRKTTCPCDGGCPRCLPIQPKLKIGEPDDVYEKEADRVADKIMRMPDPVLQPKRNCPLGKGTSCKADEEKEFKDKTLMKKEVSGTVRDSYVPPIVHEVLQSPGQALDTDTRTFFEPRFGYDFSDVRVHTDAKAAESARAVNALAFTVGRNISFGVGQYAPESCGGQRLLAHELTHVVQQVEGRTLSKRLIQRQQAGEDFVLHSTTAPDAKDKAETPLLVPRQGAEHVWYNGVMLADDKEFMRSELRRLITKQGLKGADWWYEGLCGSGVTVVPLFVPAHLAATGALKPQTPLDALEAMNKEQDKVLQQRLAPLVSEVYLNDIRPEAIRFILDFETQAKANVSKTLTTSEDTAKEEAVRYGLTEEIIKIKTGYRYGEEWERSETKYHMQTDTPVVTGLQKAASVLLTRREEIEKMEREQLSATRCESNPLDPSICLFVPDEPRYSELGGDIKAKRDSYKMIRSVVIAEYPVLAAVSEPDEGISELRTIKEKGAGDETANIIGSLIADRLAKINKVRANLNDKSNVNIWRLPQIVDTTSVQLGAHTDEFKKRIVADKVEEEKPGMLGDILLSIFNLLAVVLAPATGGISLAVAAGVNIVATGFEVQEYMMKKALSEHTFDRERALSQDEPSLLWLAVSIVGTAFDAQDIASAMRIFRNLAPFAKAAEGVKSAKEVKEATDALAMAARREGGEKGEALAKSVMANTLRARGGESLDLALEASHATSEELKALTTASDIIDTEAKNIIGPAKSTAFGEVKLSKSGHCLICSSPCAVMREKYAKALAKNPALLKELEELESRAFKVAKHNGSEADKLAEAVKRDIADLEARIRKEYPDIGRVSRAEFGKTSQAPIDWPILLIDPKNLPDVVPPGVVLEFPTGERVWRTVGSDRGIVIESRLGPGSQRQYFEAEYFSRGEMELPGYVKSDLERAHSQGQSTGFESPYAIPYAPREVNQILQNLGIEEFLRELQRNHPEGIVFGLMTNTRVHPNTRRLSLIEYTVTATYKGEQRVLFSTGIRVEGALEKPVVSIAEDLTQVDQEAFELLPVNDLAETIQARFLEMVARFKGKGARFKGKSK